MASRMKKLFRRKDNETEQLQSNARAPNTAGNEPAIHTSLYDSTTAAGLPQSGDYPIKGNDSSVVLQQQGRKTSIRSIRSRRSLSRDSQYTVPYQPPFSSHHDISGRTPHTPPPPPPPSASVAPGPYGHYQHDPISSSSRHDDRWVDWSRTPLSQDFSGLNLKDDQVAGPTTITQTVTTTRFPPKASIASNNVVHGQVSASQNPGTYSRVASPKQASSASGKSPQTQAYEAQKHGIIKSVDSEDPQRRPMVKPNRGNIASNLTSNPYDIVDSKHHHDMGFGRQRSIPRKQVGRSSLAATPTPHSSSSPGGQNHHSRPSNVLENAHEVRKNESVAQSPSIPDRARPGSRDNIENYDAQNVVMRAKSDTLDTEVIEKIAPAVVHEMVHKDIHHIREELITREIHNHDVFHRILPVIDVEVLPPRHFLPVEGGGLVEISAQEVPGRGQNWVIAETASKIPSDQSAPHGTRRFTARDFPGHEGDAVKYIASEGHEKTEETWVHPPELETGARDTGQSWPMVFGNDLGKTSHVKSSSRSSARKSPKKGFAI